MSRLVMFARPGDLDWLAREIREKPIKARKLEVEKSPSTAPAIPYYYTQQEEAVNTTAEIAWNLAENRDRCTLVSKIDGAFAEIPSRDPTPVDGQDGSQLQLTFDQKPKNLERGFVFGSDFKRCDILLGAWAAGFTREHFRINFSARGQLILDDMSQKVTRISYNGELLPSRNQFTWILFHKYENIMVTLNDGEKTQLVFKLEWPKKEETSSVSV